MSVYVYNRFIEIQLEKFKTVRAFSSLYEERIQGLTQLIEKNTEAYATNPGV